MKNNLLILFLSLSLLGPEVVMASPGMNHAPVHEQSQVGNIAVLQDCQNGACEEELSEFMVCCGKREDDKRSERLLNGNGAAGKKAIKKSELRIFEDSRMPVTMPVGCHTFQKWRGDPVPKLITGIVLKRE